MYRNAFLSNDVYMPSLRLPLNTKMYVSVMAYNNVNLTIQGNSHAFKVDVTPPVTISRPKVHLITSPFTQKKNIQYDNSVLKLSWLFNDDERKISHHTIP